MIYLNYKISIFMVCDLPEGIASIFRSGIYSGGGNQIFINEPWKIDDIEVVNVGDIK